MNDRQIRHVPRNPHHVSRRPVLARQFGGNFPRRHRLLRSGAAGRRAVRRQSDAWARRTRCGRWSSCKARIIQVRTVKKGETVGYGATWTATRPSRACDRRRRLRATASCDRPAPPSRRPPPTSIIGGKRCPDRRPHFHGSVRGRRHRSARGHGAPRRFRHPGRRRNRASTTSPPRCGTIGYEVLTGLGRRYHRVYKNGVTTRCVIDMARREHNLRLPELRRRLWALAGQVRRLRRVEHASPRKTRRRRGLRCPGARRARAGGSRSSRSPATTQEAPRLASGLAEFDRVTGGGFVRGSVLLLGGDPGIGKSTLLIQVAAALAAGRPPRGLYLGRGSGGAGAAARRAARRLPAPRSSWRPRLRSRTSSRRLSERRDAAPRHHRFDPDHVDRHGRIRARHGDAGARRARRR